MNIWALIIERSTTIVPLSAARMTKCQWNSCCPVCNLFVDESYYPLARGPQWRTKATFLYGVLLFCSCCLESLGSSSSSASWVDAPPEAKNPLLRTSGSPSNEHLLEKSLQVSVDRFFALGRGVQLRTASMSASCQGKSSHREMKSLAVCERSPSPLPWLFAVVCLFYVLLPTSRR